MKDTFKIRTVLREDKGKANGKCPIYYIVNLNGKEFKLSTGQWLEKSNWDAKNREPKGNFSNLRRILRKELMDLDNFYFDKIARNETVTPEIIKCFYKGVDDKDFFEYYERFLELKRRTEKESTVKCYVGTLNHLKKFRRSITISEIDVKFISDFDFYLRVKVGNSNGGAWARHKNLKAVINGLITDELLTTSPYGKGKFEVKKPEENTVYLDEEEVRKIANLRPIFSSKMRVNVDRFLFSCYTGFRYSDMDTVRWSDIKPDGTITKQMVKVPKRVVVPITDGVAEIIDRYKGERNDTIFPHISNDKVNEAVEVICKIAKIDKHVTFHVARHTFGYTLGKNGVNAFKIMELMGHSDIKQTMRYVKACVKDLSSALNGIELFKKVS